MERCVPPPSLRPSAVEVTPCPELWLVLFHMAHWQELTKTEPPEAILVSHGSFALPVLREANDTGVGE